MHCATCGVHFYHLDILLGNCIKTPQGYVHAFASDCASEREVTNWWETPPKPKRPTGMRPPREKMYDEPAQPGSAHDQPEHMDVMARIKQLITPQIVLPVAPTKVVPYVAKPTQKKMFGDTAVPLMFNFSDDDDTDDLIDILTDTSPQPLSIAYGHTGEKYWMHYDGHVFLGKRTKHMQGVQMAIADIYDQPVPTLYEAHYKESTYALPLNAIMHQIVVTNVLTNLAEPFRLRELKSGEYRLIYNDHEITHPIKAVLAGYVVAVRALMD